MPNPVRPKELDESGSGMQKSIQSENIAKSALKRASDYMESLEKSFSEKMNKNQDIINLQDKLMEKNTEWENKLRYMKNNAEIWALPKLWKADRAMPEFIRKRVSISPITASPEKYNLAGTLPRYEGEL